MAGLCSSSQGSRAMWGFRSFCTQEMDSNPPATMTGARSTITLCAAMAMACRPDEQKRLIVAPAVVGGRPARMAIWRAMFPPVVPSGKAQPISTSSTSAGSSLARSIAALTTCPPSVAPWVMFRAPRQDFASPVRAVDTITASVMDVSRSMEGFSFGGQFGEQRRRLPEVRIAVRICGKTLHPAHHAIKPNRVGIEHRPAAEPREAIAGEVNHVDVRSAKGDAFLQDSRPLVHQCENGALDDFFIGDPARGHAYLLPVCGNQLLHRRIGNGVALSRLVAIPTGAGLLSEPAQLADPVGNPRELHLRLLNVAALADVPAHIVAGEIRNPERSHRHSPLFQRRVDLLRQRALFQHEHRLTPVELEHPVADESIADSGNHPRLVELLRQPHHRGEHVSLRRRPAHPSQ